MNATKTVRNFFYTVEETSAFGYFGTLYEVILLESGEMKYVKIFSNNNHEEVSLCVELEYYAFDEANGDNFYCSKI